MNVALHTLVFLFILDLDGFNSIYIIYTYFTRKMQSLALQAIPYTKYGLKPGNVEAFDLDPVYGIMLITVLVLRDLEGVRV